MVVDLKSLQPGITYEINRNYYFCYGDGKIQIEQTGSVTVYIIQGNAFAGYLQNAYNIKNPSITLSGNIRLQPIDIFSNTWKTSYGNLFTDQTLQQNTGLGYLGNFWCLNPSSLTGGFGEILDINSRYFTVIDPQGTNIRLNLSSCSRM